MKAGLQTQIAPPKVNNTEVMSDAKVKKKGDAVDSTGPKEEIDFRSVLFNSNVDKRLEREAKKNGDLQADTQEEFLEKLADQTRQKRVPKNKLDKDDFLKLFVTQLQHQDPLNPDDGAEMAAKLAQFNSLEQLMNVNKALEKMATAESTNRSMMLSSFIGKDIQVSGGRTKLDSGKLTDSKFELARGAKNATLQVRDTSGILIREQQLGSLQPGKHTLNWDGKNNKGEQSANGIYTYSVMALDADGKDIPVTISSNAKVMGIDINDSSGGFFTDYGKVSLDQVKAVGEHGFYHYERNAVKDNVGTDKPATSPSPNPATQTPLSQEKVALQPKRPVANKAAAELVGATAKDTKPAPKANDIKTEQKKKNKDELATKSNQEPAKDIQPS